MSMYNILFGKNEHSALILAMLNLTEKDVGRFRSVFISKGEIAVYTRNGGGNRECWEDCDVRESKWNSKECVCPGCIITHKLPLHPNYLRDKDDEFDSTYATIYFSIPEGLKELATKLDTGEFKPEQMWMNKLVNLKGETPESLQKKYPQLCQVIDSILGPLK